MFNLFRNWFKPEPQPEQRPVLAFGTPVVKSNTATIAKVDDGFQLIDRLGRPVHTYSTKYGAVRGAQRRGLEVEQAVGA